MKVITSIASWSARHPWRAIVGWLVLVAVCFVFGSMTGTRQATNDDYRIGEAGHAQQIQSDGRLPGRTVENVVITPASGSRLDRTAAADAVERISRSMRDLPAVADVGTAVTATDGNAIRVPVTMTGDGTEAEDAVPGLLARTAAVQEQFPTLTVRQTGDASIDYQTDDHDSAQTARAEQLSLPVTLLILLGAFGAVVAAFVPLLVALSAVVAAIGLSIASSHLFPSVGQNTTLVVLIGMAVGVDYSLFYLRRAREERDRDGSIDHVTAVELAARTSGHAVMVSGLAVIVSLAALFVAGDIIFTSLAVSVMIVVAVAMAASVTVLPALLAKLGRLVDRPRVPFLGRRSTTDGSQRWAAVLRPALHRPRATLAVCAVLFVALIAPLFGMRLNLPSYDRMPQVQAIQTHNLANRLFPMQGTQFVVAIDDRDGGRAGVDRFITAVDQRTRPDAALAGAEPEVRHSSAVPGIATVTLSTRLAEDDPKTFDFYDRLRDDLLPPIFDGHPGVDYAIGGTAAMNVTDVGHLGSRLPWVVGSLLVLTMITMGVAFRSVAIGVFSALLNLLSALSALGLLALVFQSDLAARLLDLPPGGFVISRVPLFLFVILFGLATDYQVFVLTRIREAAAQGLSTREAVARGVTSSAGVITSAALVMLSVFVGFMFGGLLEIKQIGFGLAAGVALDAFVVRIFVLPALMLLLGRRNWWPGRLPAPHTDPGAGVPAPALQPAARAGSAAN